MSALLLMPLLSQAQSTTYFGSGGSPNPATYADTLAFGFEALTSNTTGSYNTANGGWALYSNDTGYNNTANGYSALYNNIGGNNNIALGYGAGVNITSSNNIDIANPGGGLDNGVIRIGTTGTQTATFIAGINGVTTGAGGVAVFIDANGQLGTMVSSRRFKQQIQSMGPVSDGLMQLRPVMFRYKQADGKGEHPLEYGLIAEEVARVYPDLVQYDKAASPSPSTIISSLRCSSTHCRKSISRTRHIPD